VKPGEIAVDDAHTLAFRGGEVVPADVPEQHFAVAAGGGELVPVQAEGDP
jgi:hypothetical protein